MTPQGLGVRGVIRMTHGGNDSQRLTFASLPSLHPGIEFQRPLSSTWTATLGSHAQRTTCINERGSRLTHDAYGSPLTVR